MNHLPINFKCNNLSLKFGDKSLFTQFSMNFNGPGIIQIEGENGTGKTCLIKLMAGLMSAETGSVEYSIKDKKLRPEDLKISEYSFFTTTSMGLLIELTGLEHIGLIAKAMGITDSTVKNKILEYRDLEIFNEILSKPVNDFSQGMKQILRLFLHLFFSPKVIFLDEPFLYLSPKLKEYFLKKIEEMAKYSLIFITDQKFTWTPVTPFEKVTLGVA